MRRLERLGRMTLLMLPWIAGCDEREEQLRTWQQRQVEQLQQQAQQNAEAAQNLVTADAESRRQFVVLEQALQAERNVLTEQAQALRRDRQELTAARERLPMLATVFQGGAALLLAIASLAYCGWLVRGLAGDSSGSELEETLILTIAGESDLLADSNPVLLASPTPARASHRLPQPPNDAQTNTSHPDPRPLGD